MPLKDPTPQAQAIAFLKNQMHLDKVGMKRDGSKHIVARRSYFYSHGQTAEKFGERIIYQMTEKGFKVKLIETIDEFAQWPKTSYFAATISVE